MEQLSIFDYEVEQNTSFQLGDKVKVLAVNEAEDSELYNYRKYYYPHVIHKTGIVKKFRYLNEVLISVEGEEILFDEKELQWIR